MQVLSHQVDIAKLSSSLSGVGSARRDPAVTNGYAPLSPNTGKVCMGYPSASFQFNNRSTAESVTLPLSRNTSGMPPP